ncbi:MAG: hypothetical protein LBN34_07320 [Clostridiales Family XIII bacterium]|jgi:hypothetical protein|nr:hypothetical protein [Clostridiales Family XIII bacterium]
MILTAIFHRLDLGSVARMMGVPAIIANSSLPQSLANAVSGNRLFVNKANSYLSENDVGITVDNISLPTPLEVRVEIAKIDHASVLTYLYGMIPEADKKTPQYAAIFGVLDRGDCSARLIKGICDSMSAEELDSLVASILESFRPSLIAGVNRNCQRDGVDVVLSDIRVDDRPKPSPADIIYL